MTQLTTFQVLINKQVDSLARGFQSSETKIQRNFFFEQSVLSLYQFYLYSFIRRSQCEEEGEDSDLSPPCIFTVGQILHQLKEINIYKMKLIKASQDANGCINNAQLPSTENPVTELGTINHHKITTMVFDKYTSNFESYYIENTTPQAQQKLTMRSYLVSGVFLTIALAATAIMIKYSTYFILPPLLIVYGFAVVTSPWWSVYQPEGWNNVKSNEYRRTCHASFEEKNKDELRKELTSGLLLLIEPNYTKQADQLDLAVSSVARVLINSYKPSFSIDNGKGVNKYTIKDEFSAYQLGYPASQVRFYGL